jgi:hypothetical protein
MPLYLVVVLVALTRLLPHPPNFACIGALALFAGYTLRSPRGILVPILALLVSDIVGHVLRLPGMGLYSPALMLFVYGGFAVVAAMGNVLGASSRPGRHWSNAGGIIGGSIAGAAVFFLISNLGVFAGGVYGYTLSGLVGCYIAALPFFLNTLCGDLFFTIVLFGSAAAVGKLNRTGATLTDLSARAKIAD